MPIHKDTGYTKDDFRIGDRVKIYSPNSRYHLEVGTITRNRETLTFLRVMPDHPIYTQTMHRLGCLFYPYELEPAGELLPAWEV